MEINLNNRNIYNKMSTTTNTTSQTNTTNMQNNEIMFKPVAFEAIKNGNFESTITKMVNGREVPAEEVTSIIFQKYSGYAPSEFPKPGKKGPGPKEMVPNPPEKRDYIKIKLDPNDPNAMELKK